MLGILFVVENFMSCFIINGSFILWIEWCIFCGSLSVEYINSIILVPPNSMVISIFQISIKSFIWSQFFYALNRHVLTFATCSFWINDVGTLFMIKKILVENYLFTYSAVTQLGKCFMLIVCDVLLIDVSVV